MRVKPGVQGFLLRLLYYPFLETPNVQIEFVYKRKVRWMSCFIFAKYAFGDNNYSKELYVII